MDEKKRKRAELGFDQISNLPEFIMHHILSYLSMKDAAKTSILSKTWNRVWSSFPIFNFDFKTYAEQMGFPEFRNHLDIRDLTCLQKVRIDEFVDIIKHRLLQFCKHDLRMQKFKLVMYITRDLELLDRWLKLALQKNVVELCVWLLIGPASINQEPWYHLRQDIFVGHNKFKSMQKLVFHGVYVNENLIHDLTLCCPFINHLSLGHFLGLKALKVSGLVHLKSVTIFPKSRELERIDIDAPNLERIFLVYSCLGIRGSSECLINLDGCRNLKEVHLAHLNIITDHWLTSLVSRLPLLESLKLFSCNMLERISISASRLKICWLSYCEKLVEAEIDAPNLVSFYYSSISDAMASLFSENVQCVWELNISLYNRDDCCLHTHWFPRLREFIGRSSQRKQLQLNLNMVIEVIFDLEKLQEIFLPSIQEVEVLRLVDTTRPSSWKPLISFENFASLFDGLLWSSHPKTLFVKWDSNSENNYKEILCEKLLDRGDPNCCKSTNVKCWRHFLKDAKIVSFGEVNDDTPDHIKSSLDAPLIIQEVQFMLEWCHIY